METKSSYITVEELDCYIRTARAHNVKGFSTVIVERRGPKAGHVYQYTPSCNRINRPKKSKRKR